MFVDTYMVSVPKERVDTYGFKWCGGIRLAVKLQRVANRKRGDKEYVKWQITIPPEIVEALGWLRGDDLDAEVKGGTLALRKSRK